MTGPTVISIPLRRLWLVLLAVLAVLGIAGMTAEYVRYVVGSKSAVIDYFSLTEEQNLPTWWSSFLLASCAVVLAMIGLYGLLSYFVSQQQAEFGIRMALGADPGAILTLVLRGVIVVVGAGLAIGVAVALASVSALQALLFDLAPRDAATIAGAAAALALLALIAAWVPARRAMRVDPVIALRAE